jgi:hypothetical protein
METTTESSMDRMKGSKSRAPGQKSREKSRAPGLRPHEGRNGGLLQTGGTNPGAGRPSNECRPAMAALADEAAHRPAATRFATTRFAIDAPTTEPDIVRRKFLSVLRGFGDNGSSRFSEGWGEYLLPLVVGVRLHSGTLVIRPELRYAPVGARAPTSIHRRCRPSRRTMRQPARP